ncbi:hypothetical protein EJ05DRAFT_33023 [Pseudovirgaria hyperparasitica]|uniref:Ferric oxidoreductase domain-containing protein n=1 Tax=Pseudovirgaria hyperparasitica TaxID=470096 RepID=A0A6A6WMB0_9PEZI|nr:uncharacterized protein EJ05DRAFT_33023 [Pseudovirgaria hyperparasitica]KAF2763288.1 hypothetical protein EJ05DRAFT_33023 [Pseudovirgaria hyperparasitica]
MRLKRITPRTCLWPLVGCLVATFALSLGLTYRSNHHCYAGTCGETLFPFQARLHVVVWYAWVSLSVAVLAFRAFRPAVHGFLRTQLGFQVPILGKQVRISGILIVLWVLGLYGILIGVWWIRLRDYFQDRGEGLPGNNVVAAVALTGHLADVTMGMVLLPVSRNSALGSFFKLSPTTTFTFHMIQAYTLFGLVMTHGILYAVWVGIFNQHRLRIKPVFPVLNPTYVFNEVWPGNSSSLGIWKASLIFTGCISGIIMIMIFCTSFPPIRRKHFNLFYFTHLLSIPAVIVICLHASTMFYCTIPGLSMWLLDWGMRLYDLSGKIDSRLEHLGRGWYRLTLPLSRKRLTGCACHSPLAHFYVHHSDSSIRELHPFTTITHLASQERIVHEGESSLSIQFLFRKSVSAPLETLTPGSAKRHSYPQWTAKLASLTANDGEAANGGDVERSNPASQSRDPTRRSSVSSTTPLNLRLEGPYFTMATPSRYTAVLCLVAGTGLSGALAIAAAFKAEWDGPSQSNCAVGGQAIPSGSKESSDTCAMGAQAPIAPKWRTCKIAWSVREADYVDMPMFSDLKCPGLSIEAHQTGTGRPRLDIARTLHDVCNASASASAPDPSAVPEKPRSIRKEIRKSLTPSTTHERSTWVYISGPGGFIDAAEAECRKIDGLDWFAARWD